MSLKTFIVDLRNYFEGDYLDKKAFMEGFCHKEHSKIKELEARLKEAEKLLEWARSQMQHNHPLVQKVTRRCSGCDWDKDYEKWKDKNI